MGDLVRPMAGVAVPSRLAKRSEYKCSTFFFGKFGILNSPPGNCPGKLSSILCIRSPVLQGGDLSWTLVPAGLSPNDYLNFKHIFFTGKNISKELKRIFPDQKALIAVLGGFAHKRVNNLLFWIFVSHRKMLIFFF